MNSSCLFQTSCLHANSLITAPKGTTIVMPEQRASSVFHLHEGVVGYFKTSPEGREAVSVLVVPPLLIGFTGFAGMDSNRHVHHISEARAITEVVYCKTKREAVWDLLDDRKARAEIMDLICRSIFFMTRLTRTPIASDVAPIIIDILDALSQSIGVRDMEDRIVIPGITHDDIAAMAKTTRPTASRTLQALERRGILDLGRRQIVVLKPEDLKRKPWA
ncbi:MAG: Crp/Fnr family transcriptional regulator [Deferrisomatales bacterium]|nr:Crp/Fnr family transcriptional regulator [Deferrisomatales bacterium]